MRRHVLLIGLSGSGKTSVGALVAARLGARFWDIDGVIERREGRPVAIIFAQSGEAGFRSLEREEMARALKSPAAVIAPGAGWAAQPGELAAALASVYAIYLRTSPQVAAARLEGDDSRPLLEAPDRVRRLTELLAIREPYYGEAQGCVPTDERTPDQVADEVERLARTRGGW